MPLMQQVLDAVSPKLNPGAADMYVDVLDIGMTRHRASACLDTGASILETVLSSRCMLPMSQADSHQLLQGMGAAHSFSRASHMF